MKETQDERCISKMARLFKVSRSGFYSYRNRKESDRSKEDSLLKEKIKELQMVSNFSLGQLPMTIKLKAELSIPLGHNRVGRIMRENDLQPKKTKRKWRPKEEKDLKNPFGNILNREFAPGVLNRAWVTDTTYIETTKGWHYLCPVMDLGNREIIGWDFSNSPNTEAAKRALKLSLVERNYPENVIFHSDRGSQFCSEEFQDELEKNGFQISLSRRGNCWDNACIESFFKGLKHDWLYNFPVMSPEDTRLRIFEYIEVLYNRFRPHGSLNWMSPVEFKNKCA
jgi:putative transposase